jgi:hypothetical protein
MSIDRCSKCSALVDTDDEPESYIQIANMRSREEWICLCRGCRERYEDEREPRQMPHGWEPTPAQQAIIDAANSDSEDADADISEAIGNAGSLA